MIKYNKVWITCISYLQTITNVYFRVLVKKIQGKEGKFVVSDK